MIWIFDPLHPLPRQWRICGYLWIAVMALRLAAWHALSES